jgi:DNA-directed RNA polymerase beta subunit
MSELTSVLTDAPTLRNKIHQKVTGALTSVFPLDLKGRTLEVKDVKVHDRTYSSEEQKKALLSGGSLQNAVKGTLVLKGADGRVIDEAKDFTLAHVPYMTDRHTIVADGNEYQFANQIRRKPGVYTQRSENGELHTAFNLGKGKNFDIGFNPSKGTFHLQYGTSNIPLYGALRGMGVTHDEIAKHLGEGVARENEKEHGKHAEAAIRKLYQKLEHPALYDPKLPHAGMVDVVKKRYGMTTLDPEVTEHTLGKPHATVTHVAMLDAAKKLLAVHNGKTAIDDTDSLAFKTFHAADDFLAERIKLTARAWAPKARLAMTGKQKIREGIRPAPFSDSIRKFVTTSSLTAVPSGINPLELLDHAVKVTSLGEGGIGSDRAIPLDARMTHATHFGALDPIRTPECLTGDAEVFTSSGWKRADALTESDQLACRINGRLEFHKAERLIAEPYSGPLHGVNTGKIQYLVTPNHRVWCAPLDAVYPLDQPHGTGWRFARADEVHGKPRVFDTGHAAYVGSGPDTFQLPEVTGAPNVQNVGPIPMADWAAFMGWYLSEGSVGRHEDRLTHTLISQCHNANPDCCEAISALLSRLPFGWRYDSNSRAFVISGKQLACYLEPFGFCQDKYIPEYFFNASIEARENLLEALLLGDGRVDSIRATGKKYKQQVFCTTSSRLAADFERLAISLGKSPRIHQYADKREERYLDVYEVRLLRDRYRQALPKKRHYYIKPHDGLVYCATVPGGLMYIRYGAGIGHWSGNSGHAGVDIRATIAAHRDDRGNLYSTVKEIKTGKQVFIKAGDLTKHIVAFPGQNLKGSVQAFVNGVVQSVPGSRVTHEMMHVSHQYSPATSLIPMIHNIQGNRAIMGSKMGTQALPLLEREVPFVQVKSHLPGEVSFESVYGHMTVPTAPVSGTVEKIENGYVYIRPHSEKKAEARTAVIITGNPRYIANNPKAEAYYQAIEDHLAGLGYSVQRDPGAPYTSPPPADLWIGHSRGADRLRFAPAGTRTVAFGSSREGAVNHPADIVDQPAGSFVPPDEHYVLTDAMRAALGTEKKAEDRPVIEQKKLGPFTFNIEIKKDHLVPGNKHPTHADYGHLPGYTGPDGDSLDFFVGTRHDGLIYAYDKQKRVNAKGDLDLKAPWKTTDVKFIVGHSPEEAKAFHRNTEEFNSPTVRFVNRRFFKDWDHLQRHIDEHHKNEKTAAKDEKGLIKVPFETNFPFPSKTYLHHELSVKPGQKVNAGDRLGDSNFTRNGTLALGKNLLVGYMPYHGLNSNDAVVISEGCAQKLTSEHMYREIYPLSSQIELSKGKHKTFYGNKYTPQQYEKLDDSGVIRKGTRVDPKDPLVLGLTKAQIQGVDLMLGRISKSLTKPYREVTLQWEHGTPGEVVEVLRSPNQIAILVKTHERMNVGDKLAGRYGNKGVVAKIVPDHEMIQDEKGRPLDLILTSAGVVSRINPAQIIETAVGKVVEKTRRPILYDNAEEKNAVKWAKDLLKQHNIKDKEHVYDPRTQRTIKGPDGKGVLVGRQFIYKLFKSTDTNFSGHGVGPYDVNEQPLKTGGDESAKGIGKMEFDAIVAHNARSFLQEASSIKSQKNDEFWRAVQLGSPLPTPKPSFAFNKFTAMLEGSGVKVDKRGSKFKLLPMTDKDVLERSRGAIENKKTLIAKNLKPETGGLFDPNKTGGPQGTLYSHIDLHEAVPHPVFVEPIRRVLGLSQKDFDQKLHDHGGKWFHAELGKIDPKKRIEELRAQMVKAKGPELDSIVKQIKYLTALDKENIKPQDAYLISKIPVIPPVFRPILPEKRDPSQLMVADANKLYAHLMDTNDVLRTTALPSDLGKHRNLVFKAVGAVFGVNDPEDEKLQKQEVKGFLQNIAGVGTPKGGFFQRKLMRRTQDMSGRGTAVPDGNLGMDEVGIPEQMLWQMYDKMIVARLVRQGYSALMAREMVDKKQPVARQALEAETRERPVLINRAPTLHRWSVVAAYPKMVQGKTIRVNPFVEKGMNLDYDGDTLQVHAPIQHGAVEDAKKMTLSQMLLSDQQRNKLMAFPQHEAIIGFTLASKATTPTGPAQHFRTREDAMAAWRSGKLKLTDAIVIDQEKKASYEEAWEPGEACDLSGEEVLSYWPAENVTGYEADTR